MRLRLRSLVPSIGSLLLVTAAACGGTGGDGESAGTSGATEGNLGGKCYGNGTCNAGLTCAAGTCIAGGTGGSGTAGSGTAGSGTAGSGTAGSGAFGNQGGSSGSGGACAAAAYVGKQAPAAMLLVVDRSASMAVKWPAAKAAVTKAIDAQVFDTMSLGLIMGPSQGTIAGPACIFNFPVQCGAPTSPQVPIADVGTKKSADPSSQRGVIAGTMNSIPPMGGALGDASPLYATIEAGLNAIKAWPKEGKRILLVVTDGTLSCNETSSRPGFPDANGCSKDWEDPNNIVKLVADANTAATPVESFIVGVPGADSYDPSGAMYPPYHMRAALSAIAYAGSPKFVDPACTGKSFTQASPDPTKSCHFDMTQGGFTADELANVIGKIRSKTLGCVFDVPVPEDGTPINPEQVNVTANFGMGPKTVYQGEAGNPKCESDFYCWQYSADMMHIELVGKACEELTSSPSPAVSIEVGCETIVVPK